jgi:4a-hydroxytetrahydrobiopterin dehydratase
MKKTDDRTIARVLLLNLLILPGLGSLRARYWFSGIGQIALVTAGAAAMLLWLYKELSEYYALMFDDVKPQAIGWIGILGGVLIALSWLWAAITSFNYYRANASSDSYRFEKSTPPQIKPVAPQLDPVFAAIPAWQRAGEIISRTYQFKDFPAALKFVNAVGQLAEQVQHHPDIDIRWNKVTLALTTHDAGGLTGKDFALARECDGLVQG